MKGLRRVSRLATRLLLAAGCIGFFGLAAPAESIASLPAPTDYVSDLAHVLSPASIAQIDNLCTQLDHSAANAQIAVVTVRSLDGDDAADYANQLEDKWKVGKKGSDKGVLVLLAVDDHKYRIDVGYGLEGILTDGDAGDIGRAMVPYLRQGDYDGAVTLAVGQVAQIIAADAKVTLTNTPQEENVPVEREQRHGFPLGQIIFFLIVLVFFGGGSLFRMFLGYGLLSSIFGDRYRGGGWGGGGMGGGGFGGGGGGGGGFGGFGGGGFGGGGAGGSW